MEQKAKELLKEGQNQLRQAGIADWDYDSRSLFQWICKISRMDLLLEPDLTIEEEKARRFKDYIKRRASHEPLQYLMRECEFMGLPFTVNEHVLIPRQDTETLVEWILEKEKPQIAAGKKMHILDVCTGSGCIAISLAAFWRERQGLFVDALDVSSDALRVAEQNSKKNETAVTFFQSDMFDAVQEKYDLIVSNPPYIPSGVVDGLMEEVRLHEPRLALDGKEDGLFFYRILAGEGKRHLKEGGRLYLEIGHDQGKSVPDLLAMEGFSKIEVKKDLAGHDRAIYAVFPGIK